MSAARRAGHSRRRFRACGLKEGLRTRSDMDWNQHEEDEGVVDTKKSMSINQMQSIQSYKWPIFRPRLQRKRTTIV
jgi:hypothetical protein